MTRPAGLPPPIRTFVDFFTHFGPRWGVDAKICRVHAYLYIIAKPVRELDLMRQLDLDKHSLSEALRELADTRLVFPCAGNSWATTEDPWEMLLSGLVRRQHDDLREMREMLDAFQVQCDGRTEVSSQGQSRAAQLRDLVDDLSVIGSQAHLLTPRRLKRLAGLSSLATRVLGRKLSAGV